MRQLSNTFLEKHARQVRLWGARTMALTLFIGAAALAGGTTYMSRTGVFTRMADDMENGLKRLTMDMGLTVEDVLVSGRKRTDPQKILSLLDVERGVPILHIDIQTAQKEISALPWVHSARIERRLPSHIRLWLNERTPVALWQNKGKFNPIDSLGEIINAPTAGLPPLPVIVGEKAPQHTPALLTVLETQPVLKDRLRAAVRIGDRRWDVILDDMETGITVHLPETGVREAWARLARLDDLHGLLKRRLKMVDLRIPDRLVVRVDEEESGKKAAKKKRRKNRKDA